MKFIHFFLILSLQPIAIFPMGKFIKNNIGVTRQIIKASNDIFFGLEPLLNDLTEFKNIENKYKGDLKEYYLAKGIFKHHEFSHLEKDIPNIINALPDVPNPDRNIPEWILNYTRKILEDNQINPQKVGIYSLDPDIYTNKSTGTSAALVTFIDRKNLELKSNPLLLLDPLYLSCFNTLNYFKNCIKASINHEITHLIKGHNYFSLSLENNKLTNNAKEIKIANEYEADLTMGLNNSQNALFNLQFNTTFLLMSGFLNNLVFFIQKTPQTHPFAHECYEKARQLYSFHIIKDQMKKNGMSIDELIARFKAQRQEMRMN